jgi:predicted RNA-binding Zn-ribbon protein involved in translation (DUF1610 family)
LTRERTRLSYFDIATTEVFSMSLQTNLKPLVLRGPLATIFKCPICGHIEIGRKNPAYDCTRAIGRARSHLVQCKLAIEAK